VKKSKKDPTLEASAESLKGKRFELSQMEREYCAEKLQQCFNMEQQARQGRERVFLITRKQVLERIGAHPKIVERAQTTLHTNDGVPVAIEVVDPMPSAPKPPKPPKPPRAKTPAPALKSLKGGSKKPAK